MPGSTASGSPPDGMSNGAHLRHHFLELLGPERLRSVAHRMLGVVVDLYQQAVGSSRYRRARHGNHKVSLAGPM